MTTNFNKISKVRANLYQYAKEAPSYDMVDLYNLINELKDLSPNKANNVLKKLDKSIIYNYATDYNSRGISIYFPYNGDNLTKESFINIYDDIGILSSYKEFISKFYNIQSGNYNIYNYTTNLISANESDKKDVYADFELELSNEQIETFAKAKYLVYKDLKTGYFKPVYNGLNATLDGNKLKASIKDRQLQVIGENNERYDLLATEVENTDKYIKYTTNVILTILPKYSEDKEEKFRMDRAIMTLYYDKDTNKTDIASVVYDSNDSKTNNIALNINDYDTIDFSISSGWKILDNKGNYTGPQIVDGKVVGDGVITGFEEKIDKFKFELSNFDNNETYYCVFIITDTYNKNSYSKLIKLK